MGSESKMITIAKARNADPATSHDAANSVSHISETQNGILTVLRESPMCDERLVARFNEWVSTGRFSPASAQSIRSRRAELVRLGLVEFADRTEMMSTGRMARVWQVKK